MLDELKEVWLYTFDVADRKAFPVQEVLLRPLPKGGGFSGIDRAFDLIARQCLFHDGASQDRAAARADDALAMLRQWCGFAPRGSETPYVPALEGCQRWMKRYINAIAEKFPGHDKKVLMAAWNSRKEGYELGLFTQRSLKASDVNEVTYQAAIARALRRGPLRRRCMVGRLDPGMVCTTSDRKKDGTLKKLDGRNAPVVIALTALCLRELGQIGRSVQTGFVPVNLQELCRWLGRGKEFDHNVIQSWLYEGSPLFLQGAERSGVKPWRVSQTWLDDGQWQLLDITEGEGELARFCEEHEGEGFWCYKDADYCDPGFSAGPWKTLTALDCTDYGRAH